VCGLQYFAILAGTLIIYLCEGQHAEYIERGTMLWDALLYAKNGR
jgi:hypothetical protein